MKTRDLALTGLSLVKSKGSCDGKASSLDTGFTLPIFWTCIGMQGRNLGFFLPLETQYL